MKWPRFPNLVARQQGRETLAPTSVLREFSAENTLKTIRFYTIRCISRLLTPPTNLLHDGNQRERLSPYQLVCYNHSTRIRDRR